MQRCIDTSWGLLFATQCITVASPMAPGAIFQPWPGRYFTPWEFFSFLAFLFANKSIYIE
jgi:hypothetical protein